MHRRKRVARLGLAAAAAEQFCEAHRGAQFEDAARLLGRDGLRVPERGFRLRGIAGRSRQQNLATQPNDLRFVKSGPLLADLLHRVIERCNGGIQASGTYLLRGDQAEQD